jgi:arylsulfatase A-like enzyme
MPAQPSLQLYAAVDATPFGDELVLDFALRALAAEKLGGSEKTDLLAVSFSSVDYVGHAFGPDSPEIHEMVVAVDKVIGQLLDAAEKQAGRGNVVAVFSADHGVATIPEANIARNMPGGRIDSQAERAAVEQALRARFGAGNYIAYFSETAIYFTADPGAGKQLLDRAEMQRVAAAAMRAQPHVMRVYTRTEFENGAPSGDVIDRRVRNGFHQERSGDVMIVHEPNWQAGGSSANHGSPFSYDTHVPVIFLGPGRIKAGQYHGEVGIQDIGPTLAQILGIATPTGSVGRVLGEMLP